MKFYGARPIVGGDSGIEQQVQQTIRRAEPLENLAQFSYHWVVSEEGAGIPAPPGKQGDKPTGSWGAWLPNRRAPNRGRSFSRPSRFKSMLSPQI